MKLYDLVKDIKESKDYKKEWVEEFHRMIKKHSKIGTKTLGKVNNVIGELFGYLHINEKPIYNACPMFCFSWKGTK